MTAYRSRVVSYIEPELLGLYQETADALGQTRSALVAEVLGNAAPVLAVLRDTALSLKQGSMLHRDALEHLAQQYRPMVDDLSASVNTLEDLLGEPPATNRGVRNG